MSVQERIREAYGNRWEPFIGHASAYLRYCNSPESRETWTMLEEPLWNWFFDQHDPLPDSILDYGSGFGKLVLEVIERRIHGPDSIPHTMVAYEPNTILFESLNHRCMSFVTKTKTFDPSTQREQYDLVISNMVFNHFDNDKHAGTFRDIHTVLAPSGTLAYVVPFPHGPSKYWNEKQVAAPWGGKVSYFHRTIAEEISTLDNAGFMDISTKSIGYEDTRNVHVRSCLEKNNPGSTGRKRRLLMIGHK